VSQDHLSDLAQAVVTAMRRAIAEAVLFNYAVADRLGLSASEGQFLNLLELHGPLTARAARRPDRPQHRHRYRCPGPPGGIGLCTQRP